LGKEERRGRVNRVEKRGENIYCDIVVTYHRRIQGAHPLGAKGEQFGQTERKEIRWDKNEGQVLDRKNFSRGKEINDRKKTDKGTYPEDNSPRETTSTLRANSGRAH